jgi:sugar phosphate isomerase/epimerase
MRFGAPVFGYKNAQEWAEMHIHNGYGAAYWPLPLETDWSIAEEYYAAAQEYGLVISEIGAWNNLLAKDLTERERNIQENIKALKLADKVRAKCCINISGSYADTWDGPHPENMTEETFEIVIETVCRIIDSAEPENTYYTLEPMPWLYPNSIETMGRLLDAINRPRFAVHVDMCNLMNSFEKVYHTGEYTSEFFRTFGDKIKAVHAKDIRIAKTLTMQIYEELPGQGIFDFEALLRECNKLDSDIPVMAEHLMAEAEYKRAVHYLQNKALEMKLKPIKGHMPEISK